MNIASSAAPTPPAAMESTINAGTSMAHQQINDLAVPGAAEHTGGQNLMTTTAPPLGIDLGAVLAQLQDGSVNKDEAIKALVMVLTADKNESSPIVAATTSAASDPQEPVAGDMPAKPAEEGQPEPAAIAPTQPNLDKHGLSGLSIAELHQLSIAAAKAAKAAEDRRQADLESVFQDFRKKVKEIGVPDAELVSTVKAMAARQDQRQGSSHAPSGSAVDKNGQKPALGVTYKHPTTGQLWKKPRLQGVAKKVFVECIRNGRTWEELKVSP